MTHELLEMQKVNLNSTSIAALEVSLREVHSSYSPKASEYEYRRCLVHSIDAMVKQAFGNVDGFPLVEAFGSFVMDMFTTDSDLDLSINFNSESHETCQFSRDEKINILKKFLKVLSANKRKGVLHHLQPILKAKVPIIKFIDYKTRVECDVSVENKDGLAKSFIIFLITSIDERFKILSFLMKLWAKAHKINSSKDQTLSSLSIVLLVALHLQTRDPPILPPFSAILKEGTNRLELQNIINQFNGYGKANRESVAELFVSLLCQLLSMETLWKQGLCASVYEGSWSYEKSISKVAYINVEDILDRTQNCARAVTEKQFKVIYTCIRNAVENISLLDKEHSKLCLKELFFPPATFQIPKKSRQRSSHNLAIGTRQKKQGKVRKIKTPLKDHKKESQTATSSNLGEESLSIPPKTLKRKLFPSDNQIATPSKFNMHAQICRDYQAPGNIGSHNTTIHNIGAYSQQGHPFLPSHPNDICIGLHNRLPSFPSFNPLQGTQQQLSILSDVSYGKQPPQQIMNRLGQSYNPSAQQLSQFHPSPHEQYMQRFLPPSQGAQRFQQHPPNYHPPMVFQGSSSTFHNPAGQSCIPVHFHPTQTPIGQSYMPGLQQPQMNRLVHSKGYANDRTLDDGRSSTHGPYRGL